MTYDEFAKQVFVIKRCMKLVPLGLFEKVCFEKTVSVLAYDVEEAFLDRENNFRLWLNGKPCYFTHPQTKNTIAVKIGDSIPAIYHFLAFCKGLKEGKHTDIGYLAFLLAQNDYTERSNQCPTM